MDSTLKNQISIEIRATKQYGPAVTAYWSDSDSGTYSLDGTFSHGSPLGNFLGRGRHEVTDDERQAIANAIVRVGQSGVAETLTFEAAPEAEADGYTPSEYRAFERKMACGDEVTH